VAENVANACPQAPYEVCFAAMALFPHDKLDWSIRRLEQRLDQTPDDASTRLDYARHCLSKAWFHDGGEVWFNKALTQARRVLQHDPASPGALVVAGASLVGLDRLEPAQRYLDEALRVEPEGAAVHLALGAAHEAARRLGAPSGDRHQAVREVEMACRLAADAWEPHWQLGRLLWARSTELGGPSGGSKRMTERSQFHTVRALELGPSAAVEPRIVYHLAITCLHDARFVEADKLFTRLLDDEKLRPRAQYYLGLVHYHLGKYKNAVLYLRQHLSHAPESPRVHARIGMCYLQLGEVVKAREACNRALAIDPSDLQARWTLGCALVEEGRDDDALRAFKQILQDAPDHQPAFQELVRLRARRDDAEWLQAALRAEIQQFDRLPVAATSPDGKPIHPRQATRDRLGTLVRAVATTTADPVADFLAGIDLTTDESLRFALWEAALDRVSTARAKAMGAALQEPGRHYGAEAGREVLALAQALPEQLLTRGLQIDEEHLRRQAVDRHGPARDVTDHRQAIDDERREARAWQALLLLSIASHGNRSSRSLLVRWAAEADADLAEAARAALAMLGDESSAEILRKRARSRGAENLVDAMLTQVGAPSVRHPVRPAGDDEEAVCSTCGRRNHEVALLLVGSNGSICSQCLAELARHRRELQSEDPEAVCALSGRNQFEVRAMYTFRGLTVCREVVDDGLGRLEREAVHRYLAEL